MAEYKCPKCKKPLMERGDFFPFCCERCKMADLGDWATGKYAIPGEQALDETQIAVEDESGVPPKKPDAH